MSNSTLNKLTIIAFGAFLLIANEYKWFETINLILMGVVFFGVVIGLEVLNISERVQTILDKFSK